MDPRIHYIPRADSPDRLFKWCLIPLLPVVLIAASCPSSLDPAPSLFDEFEPFGLGGGYRAGSIVDTTMQPVLLYDDWKGLPFTKKEYPKGTMILTEVAADSIKANAKVAGIEAVSGNITKTTLTIHDGYIAIISLATLLEHIQTLDRDTRTRLLKVLRLRSSEPGLHLLTEVIVVNNGILDFQFQDTVDIDIGTSIADLFKMKFESFSHDSKELTLSYRADTVVGYKYDNSDMIELIIGELNSEPKTPYYRDQDGDGYGSVDVRYDFVKPPGYSRVSGDCLDTDSNVFPRQTDWFDRPNAAGGFDYNCDGEDTPEKTEVGDCKNIRCGDQNGGWDEIVPLCGKSRRWLVNCSFKLLKGGCIKDYDTRRQKCR